MKQEPKAIATATAAHRDLAWTSITAYYSSILARDNAHRAGRALTVPSKRLAALLFLTALQAGFVQGAIAETIAMLGASVPDPFPLSHKARHVRLTVSLFQPLNLAGGLQAQGGELLRRTGPKLEETVADMSADILVEGRIGKRWDLHARSFIDDNAPGGVGVGGSYAILHETTVEKYPNLRGYVLSLGAEVNYITGKSRDRPDYSLEGKSLSLHAIGGAHLTKRFRIFAGWREQGGLFHLRLFSPKDEGFGRFIMRLGGPVFGATYAGKYVGLSYQVWIPVVGGIGRVVPLPTLSFFTQF